MSLPKRIPPLGIGSSSMAMGASDPRHRRNAQAPLGAIDKKEPYGVDDKGRKTVRDKVRALDPAIATVADLIEAMQEAGMMER